MAEAARQVNVEFDLIILDEAHRTAGARDREFVTLLHNDKIKARRRLFMTATERKINGDDDAAFSRPAVVSTSTIECAVLVNPPSGWNTTA